MDGRASSALLKFHFELKPSPEPSPVLEARLSGSRLSLRGIRLIQSFRLRALLPQPLGICTGGSDPSLVTLPSFFLCSKSFAHAVREADDSRRRFSVVSPALSSVLLPRKDSSLRFQGPHDTFLIPCVLCEFPIERLIGSILKIGIP